MLMKGKAETKSILLINTDLLTTKSLLKKSSLTTYLIQALSKTYNST